MNTYKTAPPLIPAIQQQSHHEKLTGSQVEEAIKMGIKGMTTNNTQYDLLKTVKFQKKCLRHTSKYIKNLVKKHGRKDAKVVLNNAFEKFGHL